MSSPATFAERTPLLELRDVNVEYPSRGGRGRVRAVNEVSLRVGAGESVGIVGESGCGKSSLVRCIVGLVQPQRGEILFEGRPIAAARGAEGRAVRRRIQMVFQDPYASLNPRHRIGDIVAEGLRVHEALTAGERQRQVVEMLERVGLSEGMAGRYPDELSGGQRQRVAIARSLILRPDLLILDEPVSALDVSVQSQVLQLLSQMRQLLNISYLFISHNLAVVRRVCEQVAVMYLGRIVEWGPTERVLARPGHPYTDALIASSLEPDAGAALRPPLAGDLPSPVKLPAGCAFHPRCRFAEPRCSKETPPLKKQQPYVNSEVACHFSDKLRASGALRGAISEPVR